MGIKLGNSDVTKVMLGSQEVSAVYKGTDEVWSAGGVNLATYAQTGPVSGRTIYHQFKDNGQSHSVKKTFEVWFRKNSAPNQGIYSCIMGEVNSYPYWAIGFNMGNPDSGNSHIQVLNMYHSDTYSWIDVTSSLTEGWHHIAVQTEGARMIVHLDGLKKADKSASGNLSDLTPSNSYSCPGGCSHRMTAFGDYFDHRVSDIWRYGEGNFSVPAVPFEPDANTLALTNRGDEFVDYGPKNVGLVVGTSLTKIEDTPYG